MTKRPYKLTRVYVPLGASDPQEVTIATYATLGTAVAGARREYGCTSDDSLVIWRDGRQVRCLYHHGVPTDERWTAK